MTELQDLYRTDWWQERPYAEDVPAGSDDRPPLVRDRDRITHSRAFRRLSGKTQVIGSLWAHEFRNRLTHTLEVSQIGRSLARTHCLDEALIESACLAHDIGHPPFGHAGERRLNELMSDYGGFDANAQTLRVLLTLEQKGVGRTSLNLTRATYWSVLKYPYRRTGGPAPDRNDLAAHGLTRSADGTAIVASQKYLYDIDLDTAVRNGQSFGEWLGSGEMTPDASPDARLQGPPPRTLACQVMDWADDVAYAIHDFEDAVLAGFITAGAVTRVRDPLLEAVARQVSVYYDGDEDAVKARALSYAKDMDTLLTDVQEAMEPETVLRPQTREWFGKLVDGVSISQPGGEDATTLGYELEIDRHNRVRVSLLARLGFELLIRDERIVRYLRKGTVMLERCFEELMADPKVVDDRVGQLMPRHTSSDMKDMDDAQRARAICDYLASMTEPGLAHLYGTLYESSAGTPFL